MSIDLHHHIQIKGQPENIYKALTTPDGIKAWWTQNVHHMDAHVGGKAYFAFDKGATAFKMKIIELIPHQKVRWECIGGNADEWIGTTQEFEIGPQNSEGIVDLRFTHGGWRTNRGHCYMSNTTWGHLFVNLKHYIEKGSIAPYFD